MMMKISPDRISKLRSRMTTKSPYAMVRSRTSIALFGLSFFADTLIQNPTTLKRTVKVASATIINTIPVTTAEVAASPTADELLPQPPSTLLLCTTVALQVSCFGVIAQALPVALMDPAIGGHSSVSAAKVLGAVAKL